MSLRTASQTFINVCMVIQKQGRMFRPMLRNWVVWVQVVTVTASVMVLIFSAIVVSQEIDHHVLPTQLAFDSVVDAGLVDSDLAQSESEAHCHSGHSCTAAILPGKQLTLKRFGLAPEFPSIARYPLSGAGCRLFHPPRIHSQV